jgi:hypothetical protein
MNLVSLNVLKLYVSESIKFINKAWYQVSTPNIVNCWRKADIIENINNNSLNEIVLNNESSVRNIF